MSSTSAHPLPGNALWGQLLRKNTLATPSTVPVPPTAPLDKTGTSMRILLHDTQTNFEKFSARVERLTSGIDDTKRELVIVKDLFQGAQESLTLDIVDLVNRTQTQIQNSLGEPAQVAALELLRKDVDARLDGLSQRIDDMQSFNQTQAQALHNVTQTLQSLQDQQGKILSAVLPLLPLLQAVPTHIDSARSNLCETILKASLESVRTHNTPPQIETLPPPPRIVRKRSIPAGASVSPFSVHKKPRLDSERMMTTSDITRENLYSNPQRRPSLYAPKPRLSHPIPSFPNFTTPRRPLGELPIPPNAGLSPIQDEPGFSSPPANRTPLMPPALIYPHPHMQRSPSPDVPPNNKIPVSPSPSPEAPPAQPFSGTTDIPNPSSSPNARSEFVLQPVHAAPQVSMVRGRRSPFRDGRRFIPLDDDDSDSDDD
ncbi:hypothetical protein R3P38DRAFT_2832540 [Favolaschia claudopus]|uniref:Uncharacterized protein n=1 Tax=Favolaschia claudopus TaxID=2862362 RepID=A0AAW0ECN3_9AGAR